MLVTLAIHDTELECAKRAISGLIRREGRTHGDYVCIRHDEVDEVSAKILSWISARKIEAFIDDGKEA